MQKGRFQLSSSDLTHKEVTGDRPMEVSSLRRRVDETRFSGPDLLICTTE